MTRTIVTETVLNRLQDNLSVLSADLVPLHERLVTIRRKLVALAAKGGSPKAELKPLQEELRKIDSLSIMLVSSEDSNTHAPFMTKLLRRLGRALSRLSSWERVVNV